MMCFKGKTELAAIQLLLVFVIKVGLQFPLRLPYNIFKVIWVNKAFNTTHHLSCGQESFCWKWTLVVVKRAIAA